MSLLKGMLPRIVAAGLWVSVAASDGLAQQGPKDVTYSGRVVDGQGRPMEGAQVQLFRTLWQTGVPDRVDLVGEVKTPGDGSFRFSLPAGGASDTIVARKVGLAWGWINARPNQDGQGDIPLVEPRDLSGQVVDGQGRPVPDAEVTLAAAKAGKGDPRSVENSGWYLSERIARRMILFKTDGSGWFTLKDLPADAACELLVTKPGWAATSTLDWASASPRSKYQFRPPQADIKVVLPAEAVVTGIVVEKGADRPVADVNVVLMQGYRLPWGHAPVRSRANGSFTISGLAPGKFMLGLVPSLRETAEWVAEPVAIELAEGQAKGDARLELAKGGVFEVVVKEAGSGRPIDKASVSVRSSVAQEQYASGLTDDKGIAAIRLLPGGYRFDGVFKQGYAMSRPDKPVSIQDGRTERIEVTLASQPRVRGVVRDPNGRPLGGAELVVMPVSQEPVTSDSEGRFDLAWDPSAWGQPDTTFCLMARHERANLASAIDIGKEVQTLDVKLEPGVTFLGRVVDPNGRALSGAQIWCEISYSMWGARMGRRPAEADQTGGFEIKAMPAGHTYSITASAQGYGEKRARPEDGDAVAGKRLDMGTLALAPANLSVSGRVVDTQGNTMAGLSLNAYGYDSGQPGGLFTRTDDSGRFSLTGVCAGPITVMAEGSHSGKRVSGRVVTEGGASGIKLVVGEGRMAITRYFRVKTREQILKPGNRFIAGTAVDEKGRPMADVPVEVCCHKAREGGKSVWQFGDFSTQADVTDEQGRFVIELKEDGEYNLRFLPAQQAALIVYDVPVGKQDLKVTLLEGGTIVGQLVKMEGGQKTPIPNAEVVVEQSDRASFTHLGFDRDRTATTDVQGRFRVEHLCTEIRTDYDKPEYGPRFWVVKYGGTSQSVSFVDAKATTEVELVVRPSVSDAPSLTGRPMPAFNGIQIDLDRMPIKDKRVLVCFFDVEQRASRQAAQRLSAQAATLAEKGVVVSAVDLSKTGASTRVDWIANQKIQIPVGIVTGDADEVRVAWSVKALPWLVLADAGHVVKAEGFALGELDAVLAR